MVNYFKDKNFTFQLQNDEVMEEFAIWQAWEKKGQNYVDSQGQAMKFPIRQGVLVGKDGQMRDVNDLKMMKRPDFVALYPDYSKSTTYSRDVVINGNPFRVRFKYTANNALKGLMDTIKAMGGNPFAVLYQQIFDKEKPAANMYSIKTVGPAQPTNVMATTPTGAQVPIPTVPVGYNPNQQQYQPQPLPQQQTQYVAPQPQPIPQPIPRPVPSIPASYAQSVVPQQIVQPSVVAPSMGEIVGDDEISEKLPLNEIESQILETVKGMGARLDEQRFIQLMIANGVKGSKATEIYNDYYK